MGLVKHIVEHEKLDIADKIYVTSAIKTALNVLDPQESVIDMINAIPPGVHTLGDRYILTSGIYTDYIVEYDTTFSGDWNYIQPDEGTTTWVEDENRIYAYTADWPSGEWHYVGYHIDHGLLLGLTDDDHTQYLSLAGRAGGQTARGGLLAGEDLYIDSTANATKGSIICLSNLDVNGNRLTLDADGDNFFKLDDDDYIDIYVDSGLVARFSDLTFHSYNPFFINGNELYLDADYDTGIDASTDDIIQVWTHSGIRISVTDTITQFYTPIGMNGNNIYLDNAGDNYFDTSDTDQVDLYINSGLVASFNITETEFSYNVVVDGQGYSTLPSTLTPNGNTQTVDWDDGNAQVLDFEDATGDVTLTLSNPHAGASYIIKFIQDSGVNLRNAIWPASVKWEAGIAPTITQVSDAIDIICLFYDGTNYYGTYAQDLS